jgi:hypothetical protein
MFQPTLAFLKSLLEGVTAAVAAVGPMSGASVRLYKAGTVLTIGSVAADAVAVAYDGYADQAIPAFAADAYLSQGKPRIQADGLIFRPTGAVLSDTVGGYAIFKGAVLLGWEPLNPPKVMGTVDDVLIVDAGLSADPMANWGSNPVEV